MEKSKEMLPGAIHLNELKSTIAARNKDVLSVQGRTNHETSLLEKVQVENDKLADDVLFWKQQYGDNPESEAGLDKVLAKKAESEAKIENHETKLGVLEGRKADLEAELERLKFELKNTTSLLMRQIREEVIKEMKDKGLDSLILQYEIASTGGDRQSGLEREFLSYFCPSSRMTDKQRQETYKTLVAKYF
jgi:hypothetical protein